METNTLPIPRPDINRECKRYNMNAEVYEPLRDTGDEEESAFLKVIGKISYEDIGLSRRYKILKHTIDSIVYFTDVLWANFLRAMISNEVSKPLLEPYDLETFRNRFLAKPDMAGIKVSHSLIRVHDYKKERQKRFRAVNAGLLLWLEAIGNSDDKE